MYTYVNDFSELSRWIRDEVELTKTIKNGQRGNGAKHVQEWLCLHGFPVEIDSWFGDATEFALKRFQDLNELMPDGEAGPLTYAALVKPMTDILVQFDTTGMSIGQAVAAMSQRHLAVHPREVGGQNAGPWVRFYMKGYDGDPYPWCAGALSVIIAQAAECLGQPNPVEYTVSVDVLAKNAQANGVFVKESEVDPANIPPGSIFMHRRRINDWNHAGIVLNASSSQYTTAEGNTNDNGSANGYEFISRSRGYTNYDFVVFDTSEANDVAPRDFVGNQIDIRRHFFDEATFETYGTFFALWDGWISAGHVADAAADGVPPFASEPLVKWPIVDDGLLNAAFPNEIDRINVDKLDAALYNCHVPTDQPAQLQDNQLVTVHGFPAGSAFMSSREGYVYLRASNERKWIIAITSPSEPVTSGMSGGVVLDVQTGDPVAIIVERNSKSDIDGDQIPMEHSLRVISLHDVWRAINDSSGFV